MVSNSEYISTNCAYTVELERVMKSSITCFLYLLFILVYYVSKCHSIVPKAYKHHKTGIYHNLIEVLTYNHSYKSCYLLTEALKRFEERLTLIKQYPKVPIYLPNSTIDTIKISITKGCNESNGELWPSESINETCMLFYSMKLLYHRFTLHFQ